MTSRPKSLVEKAEPVTRAWIKVLDYWPQALLSMLPLLSLAVAIFPETTWTIFSKGIPLPWVLGIASVVIAGVGGLGTFRRSLSLHSAQEECRNLEQELTDARNLSERYKQDVQLALSFALQQLSANIKVAEENEDHSQLRSDIRVSLYCHHHERSVFIPIVRLAGNPLHTKNGRKEYRDTQGVISLGWQQGAARAIDLPEPRDQWNKELENLYDFSAEEASKLSMQSLSMVAVRLDNDQGPVGIIVVESLKKRGVNSGTTDAIYASRWYAPTASLMLSVRESLVPHISDSD